jgi:hypothetical protein
LYYKLSRLGKDRDDNNENNNSSCRSNRLVLQVVQRNTYDILPDKNRAESSLLLSSWLNDSIFRPDTEARNAISRIDRVLAAIL